MVAIDNRPEVLAAAVRADPEVGRADGLELAIGDGLALSYPDRSFDIVHSSLVLHHLGSAAAVALMREMSRIARLGVVVNDLDRSRLGWIGAWLLGHLLTANRYTRNDAPLSVRRWTTDQRCRQPGQQSRGQHRPLRSIGRRPASA